MVGRFIMYKLGKINSSVYLRPGKKLISRLARKKTSRKQNDHSPQQIQELRHLNLGAIPLGILRNGNMKIKGHVLSNGKWRFHHDLFVEMLQIFCHHPTYFFPVTPPLHIFSGTPCIFYGTYWDLKWNSPKEPAPQPPCMFYFFCGHPPTYFYFFANPPHILSFFPFPPPSGSQME